MDELFVCPVHEADFIHLPSTPTHDDITSNVIGDSWELQLTMKANNTRIYNTYVLSALFYSRLIGRRVCSHPYQRLPSCRWACVVTHKAHIIIPTLPAHI